VAGAHFLRGDIIESMRRYVVVIALLFAACHQPRFHVEYGAAVKSATLIDVRPSNPPKSGAAVAGVARPTTGEPVSGVTIVALGEKSEQGEISGEDGSYVITSLTPGKYGIRAFYGIEAAGIEVCIPNGATARVDLIIDPNIERVVRDDFYDDLTFDLGTTKVGATITADFSQNVPLR
jgi:hypothetical protein